jgi:hypothetical protein
MFSHVKRMYRSRLPKLVFNINTAEDRMLEDPGEGGRIKNSLSFRGTGLKK